MAKSDRDHAILLLDAAGKDHLALTNMLDARSFSEEVFGFHAQQTVEKALNAWIALLGLAYPKTHDISALVRILREVGAEVGEFHDLEDYTVFAVRTAMRHTTSTRRNSIAKPWSARRRR